MIASITPVSASFKFGTADSVSLRSIADNLQSSATFFWQLGKNGKTEADFNADPASIGNVSIDGAEYLSWDGSNKMAMDLCAPKIGVTLT